MSRSLNWTKYAQELLNHAVLHALKETDFDLKMALICVDNAVEIMMKEFLSQPSSSCKNQLPSHTELSKCFGNFYALVDLCIKYRTSILDESDLSCVLKYHKLRNLMYHDGSGITVSHGYVNEYISISKVLFFGLFEHDIEIDQSPLKDELIGKFSLKYKMFYSWYRQFLRERTLGEQAMNWHQDLFAAMGPIHLEKYKLVAYCQMDMSSPFNYPEHEKHFDNINKYIKYIDDLTTSLKDFTQNSPLYIEYYNRPVADKDKRYK